MPNNDFYHSKIKISEPIILIGEGKYNLNDLKEIQATDAYVELGRDITKCQNEQAFFNCTTKHYNDDFKKKCGCLPFIISRPRQVLKSF